MNAPDRVTDRAPGRGRSTPLRLLSGNHAAALGAVAAGCRFFAGYPITPSSEILHFLSEWMPRVGGHLVQTEDELAAIGAVIGASFAGVKAMTATSGPGLALMTEMLGLAAMAEVPAVIIDVQRGGPSTGLPTKSEQADLWQALFGSHGDAPRVVLAPADVEDCFHTTVAAFNIAEETQLPVIVLSDQFIAQRKESLSMLTLDHEVIGRQVPTAGELADYKRYRDTTGISYVQFSSNYHRLALDCGFGGPPGSGRGLADRSLPKPFMACGAGQHACTLRWMPQPDRPGTSAQMTGLSCIG